MFGLTRFKANNIRHWAKKRVKMSGAGRDGGELAQIYGKGGGEGKLVS